MPKDTASNTISIDADELARALTFVSKATERKNRIPILGCTLFDFSGGKLTVTGTNLDIYISTTIDAEGAKDAKFALSTVALRRLLAEVSGALSIMLTGDEITFDVDGCSMKVRDIYPSEDWPDFVEPKDMASARIGEGDLANALRFVSPCISNEETRYYLNGVRFCAHPETGAFRLVATDGHRMGIYDLDEVFGGEPAILPTKAAKVLAGAVKAGGNETVSIKWDKTKAIIETPRGIIKAKMINGTYPDYTRAIPKEETKVGVTLNMSMARRASVVSNHLSMAVRFDPNAGIISAGITRAESISFPADFTVDGEFGSFEINAKYLIEACRAADGPVRMCGSAPNNPFILKPEDPRALLVLMPMLV